MGDVTSQSSKLNNHRSVLSSTEKQQVIQYSSYELDEHEVDKSD